jgi:hypothetical protein
LLYRIEQPNQQHIPSIKADVIITTAASKPLSLLGSVTAVGENVGAAVCEFTDVAADNIVATRKRNLVIVSLFSSSILFFLSVQSLL